jgi:hypothetical protein
MVVLVADGHLPYPYGREITGYEVANLRTTLARAKAAGASTLAGPYTTENRIAAIVRFPETRPLVRRKLPEPLGCESNKAWL